MKPDLAPLATLLRVASERAPLDELLGGLECWFAGAADGLRCRVLPDELPAHPPGALDLPPQAAASWDPELRAWALEVGFDAGWQLSMQGGNGPCWGQVVVGAPAGHRPTPAQRVTVELAVSLAIVLVERHWLAETLAPPPGQPVMVEAMQTARLWLHRMRAPGLADAVLLLRPVGVEAGDDRARSAMALARRVRVALRGGDRVAVVATGEVMVALSGVPDGAALARVVDKLAAGLESTAPTDRRLRHEAIDVGAALAREGDIDVVLALARPARRVVTGPLH